MDYKILVSKNAEEDLERFLRYLIIDKANPQAAENVLNDYDATIACLKQVAGSLRLCDNPRLKSLGYRRINFMSHKYFMLYRIIDSTVYVDNIFHSLQDYENKMF